MRSHYSGPDIYCALFVTWTPIRCLDECEPFANKRKASLPKFDGLSIWGFVTASEIQRLISTIGEQTRGIRSVTSTRVQSGQSDQVLEHLDPRPSVWNATVPSTRSLLIGRAIF